MTPMNPERLRERRRANDRLQVRLALSHLRASVAQLIDEADEFTGPDSAAIRMTMNRPFDPFSRDGRAHAEALADPIPKTSQWWKVARLLKPKTP